MTYQKITHGAFFSIFISVFAFCSVAQAASISTRVKNLENQVSKQDKTLKQGQSAIKAQDAKIAKSLSTVKTLEKKVADMVQSASVPVEKLTLSTTAIKPKSGAMPAAAGGSGEGSMPSTMQGNKPPSVKAYTFP